MILQEKIRGFYRQFISLKGDPKQIAAGFAIGVFVGVTPTIPLHTGLTVLLCMWLRQNITAAYLGSWLISNPFTIAFLYVSQYKLGQFLLGMEGRPFTFPDFSLGAIAAFGWKILLPLSVGGILMAPCIALPSYFIVRRLVASIRARVNR